MLQNVKVHLASRTCAANDKSSCDFVMYHLQTCMEYLHGMHVTLSMPWLIKGHVRLNLNNAKCRQYMLYTKAGCFMCVADLLGCCTHAHMHGIIVSSKPVAWWNVVDWPLKRYNVINTTVDLVFEMHVANRLHQFTVWIMLCMGLICGHGDHVMHGGMYRVLVKLGLRCFTYVDACTHVLWKCSESKVIDMFGGLQCSELLNSRWPIGLDFITATSSERSHHSTS